MHRWRLLAVLGALALFALPVHAGNFWYKDFVLFGGTTDSTEQVSPWIPVKDADRVIIRTYSGMGSSAGTSDSTFSDSIATFKVAFSDSVSGYAGGSGNYPIAIDSVVVNVVSVNVADSSSKLVAIWHPPLQERLTHTVNGGGTYTLVLPMLPNAPASVYGDGGINPGWMRVLATPGRRFCMGGDTRTVPCRVNGIKLLKMTARVVYRNR